MGALIGDEVVWDVWVGPLLSSERQELTVITVLMRPHADSLSIAFRAQLAGW